MNARTVESLAKAMYPGSWNGARPAVRRAYTKNAKRALKWAAQGLHTVWGVRIQTPEGEYVQQCESEEEARTLADEYPHSIFPVSCQVTPWKDEPNKIQRFAAKQVRQEPCEECGSMVCPYEYCQFEHTMSSFEAAAVPCRVCHKPLVPSSMGLVRYHWRTNGRICAGSGEELSEGEVA